VLAVDRKTPVTLPEGYLDFYKSLEHWQNEQEIVLKGACSFKPVDSLPLVLSENKPLVQVKGFKLDPQLYQDNYSEFLNFLYKTRPELVSTLDKIKDSIPKFNFQIITSEIINGTNKYLAELAADIGVPVELFIFTFDHALRPFLRIYANPYKEELVKDSFPRWETPTICPICNARSNFSRLRQNDGRRMMYCDRCFSEWEAKYLQCVYCGNDEPGTIRYISVENDDPYQLYICDKCKGYLKTLDERQSGSNTDMFIANIETVYLDMLAKDKGFINPQGH
jgi:FdhE protein